MLQLFFFSKNHYNLASTNLISLIILLSEKNITPFVPSDYAQFTFSGCSNRIFTFLFLNTLPLITIYPATNHFIITHSHGLFIIIPDHQQFFKTHNRKDRRNRNLLSITALEGKDLLHLPNPFISLYLSPSVVLGSNEISRVEMAKNVGSKISFIYVKFEIRLVEVEETEKSSENNVQGS